ncbi:hypothetical protein [Enterococcus sp. AZ109]|uniref:hypothetical protein n=1 Tax=Enterococcus sp. AZ109 TaxID=2774634 RepID=UPI003F21D0DA
MKAKKENKVYTIDETQKQRYLDSGYDIFDDKGVLLEHSPLKLIKYSEYDKLLKEKETLEKELALLKTPSTKKKTATTKDEESKEGE